MSTDNPLSPPLEEVLANKTSKDNYSYEIKDLTTGNYSKSHEPSFVDSRLCNFETIIAKVRDRVNGVIDSESVKSIIRASIKFCEESDICFYQRGFARIYAGQYVTFVKESEINHNAEQEQVKTAKIIKIESNGNLLRNGVDYLVLANDCIKFNYEYDNVVIMGTFKPVDKATQLPQVLIDDWSDTIADGASYYLCLQQGRPWSNGELATYYKAEFIEGYRRAKQFRMNTTEHLYTPYHPTQCYW